MKILMKNKNKLIAILISLTFMVGAFLGVFLSLMPKKVVAETYNYGDFNPAGYYTIDGAVFYAVKVKAVENDEGENNYWPTYKVITTGVGAEERPAFIKFGETVILEEGQSILVSFGRQTESGLDDDIYIINGAEKLSAKVDFLTQIVNINGEEQSTKSNINSQSGGEQQHEFGHIIDLYGNVNLNENSLGVSSGEDKEGLIEIFAKDFELAGNQKDFGFMFYAFKHATYERKEDFNINNPFSRPEPALKVSGGYLAEYVVDPATVSQFFSESFYYYADQKIPYLEFDYARYEVDIIKTIHSTTITYKLDYNKIHGKTSVAPNPLDPWVKNEYAQNLIVEHMEGTRAKVYFSDLGVYDFLYSAVYYKDSQNNAQKVYLETINDKYGAKKDRMAIFGTQAIYQKMNGDRTDATPFRYGELTADITGLLTSYNINNNNQFTIGNNAYTITGENGETEVDDVSGNVFEIDGVKYLIAGEKVLKLENHIIASTNQPQVSFLFNSTISDFKVYYAETLDSDVFEIKEEASYTTGFSDSGYYYVEIVNKYRDYKYWNGNSVDYTSDKPQTQIYLFQIKNRSPKLEMYALEEDGDVASEENRREIFGGNYVKNGVQIFEAEKTSVFDSPTYIKVNYRTFAQSTMIEIDLYSSSANALLEYGITKKTGGDRDYYTFQKDGYYSVRLQYGRGSSSGTNFNIDNEEIDSIKLYSVKPYPAENFYSGKLLAEQGTFATTNRGISLSWGEKASKAPITAHYVRFDMISNNYKSLLDGGNPNNDNDYIINSSWLAADYGIMLSDITKTEYNKSESLDYISGSSVLSLNGLYIFKLEDIAGNVAFYSVLIDSSIPTVIQGVSGSGIYQKVMGSNNISANTDVFFGSHKAIPFLIKDDSNNITRVELADGLPSNWADEDEASDFISYFKGLFSNLNDMGASDYIRESASNCFLTVPIKKVLYKLSGSDSDQVPEISKADINKGYHTLVPERRDGRLIDMVYTYIIYDESNTFEETSSRSYSIRVNTDQTGIDVIYTPGQKNEGIYKSYYDSESNVINSKIIKYHTPINAEKLYLTWDNLHHEETMGAYVNLAEGGLVCKFYPLEWDGYTYSYAEIGITVHLDFTNADEYDGESVAIPINFINSITQAGKYEIIRKYSSSSEEDLGDLGDDYEEMTIVIFVDRNPIISAPDAYDKQFGGYSFLTLFDGGDNDNKQFYNTLYQQQSQSERFSFQTNKLPIGIYIPFAKYGSFYDSQNKQLNLTEVQNKIKSGEFFQFSDSVLVSNLDNANGKGETYSPFELYVVLQSPSAYIGKSTGISYYYEFNSETGYLVLSGYSVGNGKTIKFNNNAERQAFITKNPITGKTEYETGTYRLIIKTMEQNDLSYLQNYNFLFNISDTTPEASMEAQYPDLENMQSKEIAKDRNTGVFYTNTNQILVSWQESNDDHLTKVDLTKVQYTTFVGSAKQPTITIAENAINVSGMDRSFLLSNIAENVSKIEIVLIYKVYSTDNGNNYKKFYSKNEDGSYRYQSTITIMIDKKASGVNPNEQTDSITKLIANDETVKGLSFSLLRETVDSSGKALDTRFNKTKTSGTYKYYSFMASEQFIIDLATSLKINDPTNTKYFYYRKFSDKYMGNIYETGLGLDSGAAASNVFTEATAGQVWSKITEDSNLDSLNFEEGYYEIIELDLAGNMTVYTIYIPELKELNINLKQKVSVEPRLSLLQINKKIEDGSVNIEYTLSPDSGGTSETLSRLEVNSFDTFNFESFYFEGYQYQAGASTNTNSYKYIKFSIDKISYLITPFNYVDVEDENGDIKTLAISAIQISGNGAGNIVNLNELKLNNKHNSEAYLVKIIDTVNGETHNLSIKVPKAEEKIKYGNKLYKDILNGKNIALVIREGINASLKIDPTTVVAYKFNGSDSIGYKIIGEDETGLSGNAPFESEDNDSSNNRLYVKKEIFTTANEVVYSFYIKEDGNFDSSTFYFAFKDDFGNEYIISGEYEESAFGDRYEYIGNDLTAEMKDANNILVSNNINVNFSNLKSVSIQALINGRYEINDALNPLFAVKKNESAYQQYTLHSLNSSKGSQYYIPGYNGGIIVYRIEISSEIPNKVLSQLQSDFNFDEESDTEIIYITIYNQLPEITITGKDGIDITEEVFGGESLQSDAITISFSGANDISEDNSIYSRVFLQLRGSEAGYYQLTSPTTIIEPGVYDIYLQNFKADGKPLDKVSLSSFAISSIDMIFYTVVKENADGSQEIISPTGKVFTYTTGSSTEYIPYHYIVNSDFDIKVRSNVKYELAGEVGTTKIYRIYSTSGAVFSTKIAITVIPATENILGPNGFFWYAGTELSLNLPQENYITSTSQNIFLYNDDEYNEISLRWKSYYNSPYNKIVCYVSSDDGITWNAVKGVSSGEFTTLTLTKSSIYTIKFVDYAGNTQIFHTASGYPSPTTKISFLRSVIYKLNEENPLDNSIYNNDVVITVPISTRSYYSATPRLYYKLNNGEEKLATVDKNGDYVFTEPGVYTIYFSVSVKFQNESRSLNEDKLTFTIINKNDSRWAFNYVNYNNYKIDYIRYNGVNIPNYLKSYAISSNPSEINISSFLEDSLGNKYFNNGIYTIKITGTDDALGEQSFEFDFWLNSAKPPISISASEGEKTTKPISISFNTENLYEALGDCYVMINNEIIERINAESVGVKGYSLKTVRPYYIQVYTDSGKLAYSYRVEIVEPLNTITIILIVVGCVVAVGGAIIFILLRKKMKIR